MIHICHLPISGVTCSHRSLWWLFTMSRHWATAGPELGQTLFMIIYIDASNIVGMNGIIFAMHLKSEMFFSTLRFCKTSWWYICVLCRGIIIIYTWSNTPSLEILLSLLSSLSVPLVVVIQIEFITNNIITSSGWLKNKGYNIEIFSFTLFSCLKQCLMFYIVLQYSRCI